MSRQFRAGPRYRADIAAQPLAASLQKQRDHLGGLPFAEQTGYKMPINAGRVIWRGAIGQQQ